MSTTTRVLLLDDNAIQRKFLSLAISDEMLEIREAGDGVAALSIINEWRPDIVIVDVMISGQIDGYEVCQAIRRLPEPESIYIAILSSCDSRNDIENGLNAGANEYLVKPATPAAIKQVLVNHANAMRGEPASKKSSPTSTEGRAEISKTNSSPRPNKFSRWLYAISSNPTKRLLPVLIAGVFTGEYLIMLLLAQLPGFDDSIEATIDATLLSIFCFPILYFFVINPIKKQLASLKEAEIELSLTSTAFNAADAIMITDAKAKIIRVNDSFEKITGYSPGEAIGQNASLLKSGIHNQEFYQNMWSKLIKTGSWRGEIWDKHKNQTLYPKEISITAIKNAAGVTTHYVGIFKDLTASKKTEEEFHTLSYYDSLTGLPNRKMLLAELVSELGASETHQQYGALIHIGLDHFKLVNDTQGHDYGDQILIEARNRISQLMPDATFLARFGGDEFMIIANRLGTDMEDANRQAIELSNQLRAMLSSQYHINSSQYHITASVGLCLFKGKEATSEDLIKRTDIALQNAKKTGGNSSVMFETEMEDSLKKHAAMEAELRSAITNQELHLYYQLQKDEHKQCIGAEALIRWIHPERGIVSPTLFIPIAEQSSLILDIGKWVIETACRQLAVWSDVPKMRDLQIAVNVSTHQFRQREFINIVDELIRKHSVNPAKLKLELTESVSMGDIEYAINKIKMLQEKLGVQISLDDFGTGYSSLSYLKKLPLNQIKIDQAFVKDVTQNPEDAVMVKTIIDMANNFGLNVIAEGVETEEQFEFLRSNGCMNYQGYLFSKPIPASDFEMLIPDVGASKLPGEIKKGVIYA